MRASNRIDVTALVHAEQGIIIDVRNKIVSRILSVYEYDSIRFYIKTIEINAQFSHIFIIRYTESRAITKTVYY